MYVRKLSKTSSLYKIKELDDVKNLCSDFLGQEMRTSENTLSVWRSATLEGEDLNDAITAALLASSQVTTSQFLIIDSDALRDADIQTDDSQLGKTAYIGFENLHTNLCDLTYEKIGRLLQIYLRACNDESRTPKIEKDVFKKIILETNAKGVLNFTELQEHMQKAVQQIIKP